MRYTSLLSALATSESTSLNSASGAVSRALWLRQLPYAVFTFAILALAWFA